MNKFFICNLLIFIFTTACKTASVPSGLKAFADNTTFVKGVADVTPVQYPPMQIAVAYYPERRIEKQWQEDFDKMKLAGITSIRIAEFSWSVIQPDEGVYHWEWLDKSIELAQKNGIRVVLCTPTATPPIWLVEKYPDVLPVDNEGRTTVFGARQHRDYHSKNYQKYAFELVEAMAMRYGNHPDVMAWQIDNELGGEQKWSFSKASIEAFQEYLKAEYHTIDELNRRWMNEFWSLHYQRFDQVNPPFEYFGTLSLKHHPSLELEFKRFSSESIVAFSNAQAEIIRRHAGNNALITHNRFAYNWGDNLNSFELNRKLDIAGYDLYSNQPHEIAFYADLNTTLNPKNSWVMEYNSNSTDLWNEMEIMNARGIGRMFIFNWNPSPAGQEQGLTSLLTVTDRPTPDYDVLKNWNEKKIKANKPSQSIPSGVGVYFDFESSWIHFYKEWGDYTDKLVYQNYVINTVYKSLFDPQKSTRVFLDPGQIEGIHTLILPWQIRYDEALYTRLLSFIEHGGQLITTHDIFQKNNDNVFMTSLPEFYTKVLGQTDNYFYDIDDSRKIILARNYGKGRVIVVNTKSTLEDWKNYKKVFRY